jgi:hypothetical protein
MIMGVALPLPATTCLEIVMKRKNIYPYVE